MIHLDTRFLIRSLVAGSTEDAMLRRWIRLSEPLGISAVAWAEFLCGPVEPESIEAIEQLVGPPTPFGAAEATLAARCFNETGRRRGSFVDCLITATAIEAGARLATANRGDFRRFEPLGLRLASATG